jgi:hypothetical protein
VARKVNRGLVNRRPLSRLDNFFSYLTYGVSDSSTLSLVGRRRRQSFAPEIIIALSAAFIATSV